MARTAAPHCNACKLLWEHTRPKGGPYASLPDLGSPYPAAMIRLYSREQSRTYTGVGWKCPAGHVTLDTGQATDHVVTPTYPRSVLCTVTGELVSP